MTDDHMMFNTELDAKRHIQEAKNAECRINNNIYNSNKRKARKK